MKFMGIFHSLNKEFSNFLVSLNTKKMKVGVISYYFEPPTISGVGVHGRLLAEFLAKNGCEVHVFCSSLDTRSYRRGNVIVHALGRIVPNVKGSSSRKRLDYFLFESEVVKAVIRENTKGEFDILHTHGSLTKAAFMLKKICGIKWVHTFHAIEKMRMQKLSKEEKHFEDLVSWIESSVNYCDGAIYVSNPVYRQGHKLYSIKREIVIPNGVDTHFFDYSPIKHKNVLFVGRFSKEKGIGLFPEIIEKVMAIAGATITIVAPYTTLPREMQRIRDQISLYEKKYKERVKVITKSLGQESLVDLYRDCQVYIQPSKYESFGLCIIEAMATGRPVVAFKVGGIPELVGGCGFSVESKEEFLSKIEELLENKELCNTIGEKARQRAELFEWDAIAKKVIEYYGVVKRG